MGQSINRVQKGIVSNARGAKQQLLVIRKVAQDQTHQPVDLLDCYKKI